MRFSSVFDSIQCTVYNTIGCWKKCFGSTHCLISFPIYALILTPCPNTLRYLNHFYRSVFHIGRLSDPLRRQIRSGRPLNCFHCYIFAADGPDRWQTRTKRYFCRPLRRQPRVGVALARRYMLSHKSLPPRLHTCCTVRCSWPTTYHKSKWRGNVNKTKNVISPTALQSVPKTVGVMVRHMSITTVILTTRSFCKTTVRGSKGKGKKEKKNSET